MHVQRWGRPGLLGFIRPYSEDLAQLVKALMACMNRGHQQEGAFRSSRLLRGSKYALELAGESTAMDWSLDLRVSPAAASPIPEGLSEPSKGL